MDIGTVSARYAKALLKFAVERKEEDEVYDEMRMLAKVFLIAPKLRQMIENPALSVSDTTALLCKAAGGDVCESTKRFLSLVVAKRRTECIQFIANSYISLYLSLKNIVKSKLTVASEISDEYAGRIRKIVESHTGSKVEMEIDKNPSIGGGFLLEFGTYRIDASVNSQIKNIRKDLMRAAGKA